MGLTTTVLQLIFGDEAESDSDLSHIVCMRCFPDTNSPSIALCGTSEPPGEFDDDWLGESFDNDCVVCDDLAFVPCPGCGA